MLWLCHRLAATAPIRPTAWEPSHDAGAALKRQKEKNPQNLQELSLILLYVFAEMPAPNASYWLSQ